MRRTNVRLLVPSLVLFALACGDNGSTPPPPPLPPVASITVSPAAPSILVSTAAQLSAVAKDAQGNTLYGRAIAWSSSAEAVATVGTTGVVNGISVGGPVTITATSEGQIGTAQVTVYSAGLGFTISLSAAALSIVQGASTPTTTVNITRHTHRASVALFMTGLPAGVSGSFAPTAWPAASSSVLTLTVGAAAVPGIYNLLVNAFDPEQEGEVSAALTLTVTAPGYSLSSSISALSVAQGATSSQFNTVNLLRNSFTGNVTLSMDSLPTGVTVVFYPANPTTSSLSQFWLSAVPDAVPGTYPNVRVRGVASGLVDRTAPLTLTITVAPFRLTLSSATLSIVHGAATPTTTVNVIRDNFTGPVDLNIAWDGEDHDVLPPGVTVAFAPNAAIGNSAVLTLTVSAAATPGVYNLYVFGGASTGGFCCIPLTLTVIAAPP